MRLLCDAIPFGFGPVGKLNTLVRAMAATDLDITVLASGISLELWGDLPEVEVLPVDTTSPKALEAAKDRFRRADAFLNVMNPTSMRLAREVGVKSACVDSLFWMWHEPDPASAEAEVYLVQNFVGVPQRLADWRGRIKNPVLVGPLVSSAALAPRARGNQLLVHLGGLESPLVRFGEKLRYPFAVGEVLHAALAQHPFERVRVVGSERSMAELARRFPLPRVEYLRLDHQRFLEELASSALLLTSPGLTATFEAFAAGTPVAFLPPQNYSQFLNLLAFRGAQVAPHSAHWVDLYPEAKALHADLPEEEGVAGVARFIERFEADGRAKAELAGQVRQMLAQPEAARAHLASAQRAFFTGLGTPGVEETVRQVRVLLAAAP